MKKIRIIDLIGTPNAILHSFGIRIFEEGRPSIEKKEPVLLDFSGLRNISSAFLHASIGNLITLGKNENLVIIEGTNIPDWSDRIRQSIDLALNPSKQEIIDAEISNLFS